MVQRRPYPSRSGFFGVLLLLSVSGCATTPSPEAARVRVVQDATQVSGCQLLGGGEGVIARAVGGRRRAYNGQCPDGDAG